VPRLKKRNPDRDYRNPSIREIITMSTLSKYLLLLAAAACVALVGHTSTSSLLAGQDNIDNAPAARARFQSVPVTTPYYGGGYGFYSPYYYQNALSGAADLVNAQGQFMIAQQQAFLGQEKYFQAKIETRRKHVQEFLYERSVLPTEEDERERARLEQVRRSRNDPPPTEIWSGKALNDLLLAIKQQQAQGLRGPDVPLDEDTLKHLNLSGNQTLSSIGLLREGGKIPWPSAFSGEAYNDERKTLDQLAGEALRQIGTGPVDPGTLEAMKQAADKLQKELKRNVDDTSPNNYIKAKRFLNELDSTFKALEDPNISKYASGKWAATGRNVAQLTQEMIRQGLKFAPAVAGDEPAYTALHSALVAYMAPPDQAHRWDTAAK